jgi:branched-chain amino acid transport system permease protein
VAQFVQQLVNGVTLGSVYALIALGYTMVYGIIQLINFAHGEIFMIGGFAGLSAYTYVLGPMHLQKPVWIALPLVLALSMGVTGAMGVLLERIAYRPLRYASRLAPLITALGASIFLQNAIFLWYPGGKDRITFPRLFPVGSVGVAGARIDYLWLFMLVVALGLMIGLTAFVRRTRLGKAMRATAEDKDAALLMGIDINRTIALTFLVGSVLAAAAGVMFGMYTGRVFFFDGFKAGLKAFTAAVLGGIGNIGGAVLGGFVIGVVEALTEGYVPRGGSWRDVVVFMILVLILIFRPTGLLGERVRE